MADDIVLARAAAEAALATEGVHALGSGTYAEAATYGVNEKVTGVVVRQDEVEVHIIARYPLERSVKDLAQSVRENVASRVEGRRVGVVVEDLEVVEG